MLWNKSLKLHKGYILCYTLIIFSSSILIFLSLLKLVMMEHKNATSSENIFKDENTMENNRVYIINSLLEKINGETIDITQSYADEDIRNKLISNSDSMKIVRGKSEIYYDEINDEFVLKTSKNGIDGRYEFFDYNIENGRVMLSYKGTSYR